MPSSGRSLGGRQIVFSLPEALEKLIAFAAAADHYVLVLEHGLDDAQYRFGAQIIGAIKAVNGLEDFVFAQAGIFEGALLEAIVLDESGLFFLSEPAVFAGHLLQFRSAISPTRQ